MHICSIQLYNLNLGVKLILSINEQVDDLNRILVEHIFCLVDMQLESLYICLKIDYLTTLYQFFIASLPTSSPKQISESKSSSKTANSTSNAEVQTQVHMLVKSPEIVLLEGQHQRTTNCLVLNVRKEKLAYQEWDKN